MVTAAERAEALRLLDDLLTERPFLQTSRDRAWDHFCGDYAHCYEKAKAHGLGPAADDFFDMWFLLEDDVEDGRRPIDLLLSMNDNMSEGARAYLEQLGELSVALYEVADVEPGRSILLMNLSNHRGVRVAERTASRAVEPHALLAARVIEPGVSGEPELERGLLDVPRRLRERLVEHLSGLATDLRADGMSPREIARESAAVIHQAWLSSFEPQIPALHNTDGEKLVWQKLVFRILDRAQLLDALRSAEGVDQGPEDDVFTWVGDNARGEVVSLARIKVAAKRLFVEVNSAQRANRARALIDDIASDVVEYRLSVQEDVEKKLQEQQDQADRQPTMSLESEAVEAALLEHHARHYRRWLDEEIPMLDGATPRQASRSKALRPKLIEALKDLEHAYYRALRDGTAAFDPFWMWHELGLDDHPSAPKARILPPPLAHESMGQLVSGFRSTVQAVTKSLKARPDFDDARVYPDVELAEHLAMQRFARDVARAAYRGGAPQTTAAADGDLAAFLAGCAINHELHNKRTFWVGPGLSAMFDQTDADVPGELLRLPFASFALVFTDRHFLGIAERMLSIEERDATVVGQQLKVATVYVREEPGEKGLRTIRVTFAFDAVGAQWPYILSRVIPIYPARSVQEVVRAHLPPARKDDLTLGSERLARLANIVSNAILYTTCAEVRIDTLGGPTKGGKRRQKATSKHTADKVFHLPGTIDIQNVQRLAAIARAPAGREIMHRFLVRGHWRRPNPNWKDQAMRWIEPYWKGPDMASVIERAYRLKAGEALDLPTTNDT